MKRAAGALNKASTFREGGSICGVARGNAEQSSSIVIGIRSASAFSLCYAMGWLLVVLVIVMNGFRKQEDIVFNS